MMNRRLRNVLLVVLVGLCSSAAFSQSAVSVPGKVDAGSVTITASGSSDRMRIAAPPSVVQMRLEVYAATGERVFDEELRGANVFDWHLQNGQAARVAAGDYVCVVTAKNIAGRLSQKIGMVTMTDSSVALRAGDAQQFTSPQMQAIGPVEENSSWSVIADGDNQTPTIIANNGTEGQIIRGRGALLFRVGDFFRGTDQEQMRLTEDGNLGVGNSSPQAKLDVAGAVRAEKFLIVAPASNNSSSRSENNAAAQSAESAGSVQPMVSGTGTTGQLTKWQDGPNGTLTDSIVTEAPTSIGISNSDPSTPLSAGGWATSGLTIGNPGSSNTGMVMVSSPSSTLASFRFGNGTSGLYDQGFVGYDHTKNNLFFGSNRGTRMTIDSGGNLGLGTPDPLTPLTNGGWAGFGLTVGNTSISNTGMVMVSSPSSTLASFRFGNGTNGLFDQGFMAYNHSTNNLSFGTNRGTRLIIDGTGNVGIGMTPAVKLDVAGDVNTSTQFGIRGNRVLAVSGNNLGPTSNTFVGVGAGTSNSASGNLSAGTQNSFFGGNAGAFNLTGQSNSFFGSDAGQINTQGTENSFFGTFAGSGNSTGRGNVIVGAFTGLNSNGSFNVFVGGSTFAGINGNIGVSTGSTNQTGSNDVLIGGGADVGASNLKNATAIGSLARVDSSNSLVLGSINGVNNATADTKVGIGINAPAFRLHVVDPSNQGLRVQTNTTGGTVASFGGNGAFQIDSTGVAGGRFWVTESGSVAIGSSTAPTDKLYVGGDTRVNGTLRVPGGSVFIANPNTVIITSPNGACWGITVNNSGALSTFSTACP